MLRTAALSQTNCTQAERWNFAIEECRLIINEAKEWLADPREGVRLTLWMLEDDGDLGFVVGNVDESQRVIFAEDFFTTGDADYIGQARREQRVINEADAPEDWRAYNQSEDGAFFSGIMFVPVRWRGDPWGLLEVDRRTAQRFSLDAEVVATAAAYAMGLLLASHGLKAVPRSTTPDDPGNSGAADSGGAVAEGGTSSPGTSECRGRSSDPRPHCQRSVDERGRGCLRRSGVSERSGSLARRGRADRRCSRRRRWDRG